MLTPAALFASLALSTMVSAPETPIQTLIITGQNNHNWLFTSRVHAETLAASGRFAVDITDDPATTLADAAKVGKYQLFVLDYNDSSSTNRWGEAAEKNFVQAVASGKTGVLAIHAANNAFVGWKEYEQMLGLMWREGTGHGKVHEFNVDIVDAEHPVTKGLSPFTKHRDELYHKLVNSQDSRPHLLMQAMSSKESGGTGVNEPMAFTLQFDKGRIFATPMGHVWTGDLGSKTSVCEDQFRALICRGGEWAATGAVTLGPTWSDTRVHNTLTEQEKADGWKLLFDGSSTASFRGFKADRFPSQGWSIAGGELIHAARQGGGDIVTTGEYADFEFQVDWKVAAGGNSGIMYRVGESDKLNYPWETGPEMQILDDVEHQDGKNVKTRAGTMYALYATAADTARPAGQWNTARIVAKGEKIQYYLNGVKVVDVDTSTAEHKKLVAESKFNAMPAYGTLAKGHIALQDHGDEVHFRNIKVRELK